MPACSPLTGDLLQHHDAIVARRQTTPPPSFALAANKARLWPRPRDSLRERGEGLAHCTECAHCGLLLWSIDSKWSVVALIKIKGDIDGQYRAKRRTPPLRSRPHFAGQVSELEPLTQI